MKAKPLDIADFYQQLALLLKSNLPLPESIRQLAANMGRKDFRQALDQLGSDTGDGVPLAEAMKQRTDYFQPFHVQLVETGERSGALPQMLFEIARFARANHHFITRLREALAYPLFTSYFAFLIFCLVTRFIVPGFETFYHEFDLFDNLPPLTMLVLNISHLVQAIWPALISLFIIFPVFGIWLLSSTLLANSVFHRLIGIIPGVRRIGLDTDQARFGALLGLYLEHGVPLETALELCAEVVETRSFRRRLTHWAEESRRGRDLAEVVAQDPKAEGLFSLTLKHSPEDDLPAEMRELSQVYEERADSRRAAVVAAWEAGLVIFMGCSVGLVVMGMFLPLIRLIGRMGEGGL